MKRIVSVSLGSSTRNHQVKIEVLGETFSLNAWEWMAILPS